MTQTMNTAEKRAEAYRQLAIEPSQLSAVPQITHSLRRMFSSISRTGPANLPADPIFYLNASDSPFARAVLDRYYSIAKPLRRVLPLEAFCVAAHVPPLRIEEVVVQTYQRLFRQQSLLSAAAHGPSIMDKTIELAKTAIDETVQLHAQGMVHKINGVIPLPPARVGTKIQITQNAEASANATAQAASVVPAPHPELTIKRMIDRFNENRALPAATPAALPEAQPENVIPMPSREEFIEVEEDQ
jgi:hypothetical protein